MYEFSFLTTYHKAGYDVYGRNNTWYMSQALPKEVAYSVYAENVDVDLKLPSNFSVYDFHESVTGYKEYREKYEDKTPDNKKRIESYPKAKQKKLTKLNKFDAKDYRYDHIRFCHKTYAVLAHYENRKDDARWLVWCDADVIPTKKIPIEWLRDIVKDEKEFYLLDRTKVGRKDGLSYAECGFMIWDTHSENVKEYFKRVREQYDEGLMFDKYEMYGWHDSIIWDYERRQMEKEGILTVGDLSVPSPKTPHVTKENVKKGHPFVVGFLGEYFDHLKGKRKFIGSSKERRGAWG